MKLSRHVLTHSDAPKRKLYTNEYEYVMYALPDGKIVGYTHLGTTTEVLIKHKEPKRSKPRKLEAETKGVDFELKTKAER